MIAFILALAMLTPVVSVHSMKVTSYCVCEKCCGEWAKGTTTATGKNKYIFDGVAADPKVLPYGSIVDIPQVGVRVVDDTGGGMRKSAREQVAHIDIRMATHQEALNYGVRWVDVGIVKYARAKK